MPIPDQQTGLTPETIAQEAHALARVLRLLGHAPSQPGSAEPHDDPELKRCAEQLDAIAREPGQVSASLMTLERAVRLAEHTAKQMRHDVQGGLRQRVQRLFSHEGPVDPADPAWLADSLVHELHKQHRVITSQRTR